MDIFEYEQLKEEGKIDEEGKKVKKDVDTFRDKLMRKYLKEKEVFKALDYAEERRGVPYYVVIRECGIDLKKYNRAKYGYEDLTAHQVDAIVDWLKNYFGIKTYN